MRKTALVTTIVAASMAVAPAPALAQQSGLVNVDISNILNNNDVRIKEVLSRNNIGANVNAIVQVPIGLAANVCNISVLEARELGDTACQARSDVTAGQAQALINAIQRQ